MIFLVFLTSAESSFAFVYTSIKSSNDTGLLIERNLLDDDKKNYSCTFSTLKCYLTSINTLPQPIAEVNPYTKTAQKYFNNKKNMSFTYSPSYRYLAFLNSTGDSSYSSRTYYLIDLKNNLSYSLSHEIIFWDSVIEMPRKFAFSPDETMFAYIDDFAGPMMVHTVDLTKLTNIENNPIVSDINFSVGDFIFKDSNTIYFTAHGANVYNWQVYKYDVKSNTVESIASNASFSDKLRIIGNKLIFQEVGNKTKVPAMYDLISKKISYFSYFRPNQSSLPGIRTQYKIGNTHAVLINPNNLPNLKNRKLVIWLHGGPPRQAAFGYHAYASYAVYDWMLDELVKSGVSVLKLDYRGSQNYGRPYNDAIKYEIGRGDIVDLMNAQDYIKDIIDVSGTYLIGNSYGGYMSLKALVEHPDDFTNVMSINGVTDWWTLIANMSWSPFKAHFGGLPDLKNKTSRFYYDQSAIVNKISKIGKQKINIVHSTNDTTINPKQANLIYDYLIKNNKNAKLTWLPGDDHVIINTKNLELTCRLMFETIESNSTNYCHFPKEQ